MRIVSILSNINDGFGESSGYVRFSFRIITLLLFIFCVWLVFIADSFSIFSKEYLPENRFIIAIFAIISYFFSKNLWICYMFIYTGVLRLSISFRVGGKAVLILENTFNKNFFDVKIMTDFRACKSFDHTEYGCEVSNFKKREFGVICGEFDYIWEIEIEDEVMKYVGEDYRNVAIFTIMYTDPFFGLKKVQHCKLTKFHLEQGIFHRSAVKP